MDEFSHKSELVNVEVSVFPSFRSIRTALTFKISMQIACILLTLLTKISIHCRLVLN